MPARKKTSSRKTARKKKPAAKRKPRKKTTGARKKATGSRKKKAAAKRAGTVRKKKTTTRGKKKTGVKKKAKVARKTTAAKKKKKKAPGKRKTTTRRTVSRKTAAMMNGPVEGVAPYKTRRGESYMNESQHEHFRNILGTWKQQLMQEVDRTVHHMKDEAANFPDPNDRATQESEFSLELRTRDRERKLIKKIDEALLSVDAGEYGFCESCGIKIGVRRLEARPTATLCIDCKTLDEIRERQMGG